MGGVPEGGAHFRFGLAIAQPSASADRDICSDQNVIRHHGSSLRGCGQSSRDFARDTGMNTLAEFGFLVLYPSQARDAHKTRCWNWYRREDQARGEGESAFHT